MLPVEDVVKKPLPPLKLVVVCAGGWKGDCVELSERYGSTDILK